MKALQESTLHWWQSAVVYQVYPRSFQDTGGNGVGDLLGVIERLDHLVALGVDALWISPFYPSPMADFGYDVADYCDVDPLFGDLPTFDRLVNAAHEREMKVIIDWVPNHTSDQHPWFIASRAGRDNPKRDWYIWHPPKPDNGPPNNWGSFFGGPAWTYDPLTGEYYLHQFVKQQPELNWRNPEVRAAMMDTLRFWMRRGVDGFRMDVIHLIIKDAALRDNPPDPDAPADLPANDLHTRQLHTYTEDQDEVHVVIREIRSVLDEFPDRCGIGELWGPLDRWVRYYGEHGEGLHLPFNFRLMDGMAWDARQMRASVDALEAALPSFAWPNYVLGNHDRMRMVTRFGGQAQARVAAMMLLTLRGTPTLYYGDEIGMADVPIAPDKVQDPQGLNLGVERTRDGCRTPMQWDGGPNAGFCPPDVEPWLLLASDCQERNVAAQAQNPTSLLALYRRLLALRRATPALIGGSYCPVDGVPNDCFVYWRKENEQRLLITLNFSGAPREIALPEGEGARVILSTHLDREGPVGGAVLALRPNEGVIVAI